MPGQAATRTQFWTRWGPTVVGTSITMVAVVAASLWVTSRVEAALDAAPGPRAAGSQAAGRFPPGAGQGDAAQVPVDPSQFTPELDAWVRAVAEGQGVDPNTLPTALEMYSTLNARGLVLPAAAARQELERLVPDLAREVGDDPIRATLALNVVATARAPQGKGGADDGTEQGADPLQQLDQLLSRRLARRATELGLDPDSVQPPRSVREAALASGRLDTTESQELLRAYGDAFDQLDARSR